MEWIEQKFGKNELVAAANKAAFKAGFDFGETTEQVGHRYEVRPAHLPPGEYTSITGNTALAWGLVAAGQLAKLPVTLGSYPITPACDILHELSQAQALRHPHRAGRRRDRRRRRGARRRVQRPPRRHHHVGARRGAEERDDLARRSRSSCPC